MTGPIRAIHRPTIVDAYRFDGSNGPDIVAWAGLNQDPNSPKYGEPQATWSRYDGLVINTLDGEHIVPIGHYVVHGVEGVHYPVKSSIFHTSYEVQD